MPDPRFNNYTYRTQFLHLAERWGGKSDSLASLPPALWTSMIDDALADVQDRLDLERTRSTATGLTANTMAYTVPAGILGRDIDKVQILGSSGAGQAALTWLGWDKFSALYNPDDPSAGASAPQHWTWNPASSRQILLGPAPNYTRSNALIFSASVVLDSMAREYQSEHPPESGGDPTGAITKGTTALVLTLNSGTTPVDVEIEDGDAFGFVSAKARDGTVLTHIGPVAWYTIESMATLAVTLAQDFRERTVTADKFITAQISQLEAALPGRLRFTPVDLALANWFDAEEGKTDIADRFRLQYERRMARLKPSGRRRLQLNHGGRTGASAFASSTARVR